MSIRHQFLKKFGFWITAIAVTVVIAYLIATRPLDIVWLLPLAILIFLVRNNLRLGIAITLFLPLIGELYRLPIGGENGALLSDIATAVIGFLWFVQKPLNKKQPTNTTQSFLAKPLTYFIVIAGFSLLQSLLFLQPTEVVKSSLYLFRFVEYALLIFIVQDVIKTEPQRKNLRNCMVISAMLIAIAGFIQLLIYPDLGKLEELGWDPHKFRLVSTWLDPNFIGGFLAFIICILTGITLYTKHFFKKIGLFIVIGVLAVALFLTYSRSGYLAAGIGIIALSALKSRKLLIATLILACLGLSLSPRAQERIDDLSHTVQSIIFNTSENPDATARLRIQSWNQTLELIQKRPLFGSGYNTLPYVKYNEGFVSNSAVHSASGSDSSLLTILATTGIFGLGAFIWLYWNMLKLAWKKWHDKKIPAVWQGYSLGIFTGLLAILGHSFFVNSLLFPQIMIFIFIGTGLLATL